LAEVIEGEMAVNAPEHVIERDVFLKPEIIEQPRRRSLKPIIAVSPADSAGFNESRPCSDDNQSPTLSTVSANSGHSPSGLADEATPLCCAARPALPTSDMREKADVG
jgi:hypothetical protein